MWGEKKRKKNPKAALCVPGTHPRHCSHFTSECLPGQTCVPIFSAKAASWLRVQITVSLALDPTSEAHPLKCHD